MSQVKAFGDYQQESLRPQQQAGLVGLITSCAYLILPYNGLLTVVVVGASSSPGLGTTISV